jgi:hypothetical protein
MLASSTLIRPEVISSSAEVEIHEDKVFTHLDEEKECDTGTWVLDIGVTKHMSGCRAAGLFVCKNDESRSFDGPTSSLV